MSDIVVASPASPDPEIRHEEIRHRENQRRRSAVSFGAAFVIHIAALALAALLAASVPLPRAPAPDLGRSPARLFPDARRPVVDGPCSGFHIRGRRGGTCARAVARCCTRVLREVQCERVRDSHAAGAVTCCNGSPPAPRSGRPAAPRGARRAFRRSPARCRGPRFPPSRQGPRPARARARPSTGGRESRSPRLPRRGARRGASTSAGSTRRCPANPQAPAPRAPARAEPPAAPRPREAALPAERPAVLTTGWCGTSLMQARDGRL